MLLCFVRAALEKPYSVFFFFIKGEHLDRAMSKREVEAWIGDGLCSVKTLTHSHLYCEPPAQQPSVKGRKKQDGVDSLPEFTVST